MKKNVIKKILLELWLIPRPIIIKKLARQFPPYKKYFMPNNLDSGYYYPISYNENGTITCNKTDFLGFHYEVFGILPADLKECIK
jgi:hypothetical protein